MRLIDEASASSGIWISIPRPAGSDSDNIFAGYSWGNTTVGIGHAMLNAVDENNGAASTIKSQQVQPFVSFGKQTNVGFNFAANAGVTTLCRIRCADAGVQAVYNWNCCVASTKARLPPL